MVAKKNKGGVLLKLGVVLVVLVAVGVAAFFSLRGTARVMPVRRALAEDAVTGSVTIDADGGVKELKSEAQGKVINVHKIKGGSKFKKNDPLVLLDESDLVREKEEFERQYNDRKERAELQFKSDTEVKDATRNWENAKRLQELNDMTAEQVRAAEKTLSAVKTAKELRDFDTKKADADFKAAIKERNLQIEKMTIRAPSDGEIHEPIAWEGAQISPGTSVAWFFSNDRVVAARISEERFGSVRVGQEARLRLLTYGNEEFKATVSDLFPVADAAQRFKVFLKVEVDPERLKPNSTGEVTITVDKHDNAQIIPRRALFNGDQVFAVRKGVVVQCKVEVGIKSLTVVEIKSGLRDDDYVIVENLEKYRAGKRVIAEVVGNRSAQLAPVSNP